MSLQPDTTLSPAAANPLTFFNTLYEHFERAQAAAGSVERFYQIGGYVVQLRFAGPALLPNLTPALEHLTIAPQPAPDLTICAWDSDSTGVKPPHRPWSDADHLPRGEIRGYSDARITTVYELGQGSLNVLDSTRNLGIYWRANAAKTSYSEQATPFQELLPTWMRSHQRYMLHAAGVGLPSGGVVLGGKSGSGKSSSALACLDSNLYFLGDDVCFLTLDPAPYAYALFSSSKLKADNMWRFPSLANRVSNIDRIDREKATIYLQRWLPEKLITGFPVRALLLPRVTGRADTQLEPASPMLGLRTLAPSTLFQVATPVAATFDYLARFVKLVPTYYLNVGTDLATIPATIERLLQELAA